MKSEITKLTKAKGMYDSLELQPKLFVSMVSAGSRVSIPLRIYFFYKSMRGFEFLPRLSTIAFRVYIA